MKLLGKKILSVTLSVILIISSCVIFASAENGVTLTTVNSYESATQALLNDKHVSELEKDEVYPTILIHGIGQSKTFMIDENGNDVLDPSGDKVTGWPFYLYAPTLIVKLVVPLLLTLITQKDCGLSKTAYSAIYDAVENIAYNEDGSPKHDFRVVGYDNKSVADCTEEQKAEIYNYIPIKSYTDEVGEENLYYFAYNSFGDIYQIVDNLEAIIEKAKKDTGKDKVNLLAISLGGAISVAYVGEHPHGEDINKLVHIVPAADGSEIVGKVMLGQLDYSNEGLYRNMFTKLVGQDDYTGWLINIAIRILPKETLIDLLDAITAGLSDSALARITNMWALVPSSMYDELAEKYLTPGTKFTADVERFHNAQINYKNNLKNYASNGVKIYDICAYGLELYSLVDSDSNTDKIIHSASTSLGATFSKVNETFSTNYKQQKYTDVNFMSPDNQVDASTCAFPYTTWFFGNQSHEELSGNDVVISLAKELLVVKDMDVFTTAEYPQFNECRDVRKIRLYLSEVEKLDFSTLAPETSAKLTAAINSANALMNETIIEPGKAESVEQELFNALVDVGIYEAVDSTTNDILLKVCKTVSELVYYLFGPRGFSDPITSIFIK